MSSMKVGALAKRTGLTVRTLHHYDEIGLLSPSERTPSGHRLYGDAELRRLQQIASLRHLGLALDEIKECLARPEYSLDRVLELQVGRIDAQIERHERMKALIGSLRDRLRSDDGVTVDELTRAIEVTVSYEKYYTPEQLRALELRSAEVGHARISAAQEEWTELLAAYAVAFEDGVDPASETVLELARRSAALVDEFTGGDPGIAESLREMYRGEGADKVMADNGVAMSPELWAYMRDAGSALRGERGG